MFSRTALATSLMLLFTAACGGTADKAPVADATVEPATSKPAADTATLPGTGTVLETMNGGGYTYVRVDLGGAEVWAAGPQTTVAKGDTVTLPQGMAMRDFPSESLGRTFDVIYFVARIEGGSAKGPTPADKAIAAAHAAAGVAPAAGVGKIEKLDGGQTVAEVFEKRTTLVGTRVSIRGKVVKFNAGILGKNWIHLQDGSGSAGTNDLTITTSATAKVGDIVVIRGLLAVDKDFGSGYTYAVLVEDAAIDEN